MKIIADTNIWYELGQDSELYDSVKKEPLAPNFVNIHELSKTKNILDKEDLVRSAVQMLFRFQEQAIFQPPYIYLAQRNQTFNYDPEAELKDILDFTSKLAKGHTLDKNKVETFKDQVDHFNQNLTEISTIFNAEAEEIRHNILNKKQHKKIDTYQITGEYINFCVQTATKGKANLDGYDMDQSELLFKTVDHYFKTLETSKMRVQANDWYDYGILAYVGPEDKFWTKEKRWINLISDAGCEKYLFEPEQQ